MEELNNVSVGGNNGVKLEEIDFDELDDYLELFQQDGIIKEALSKGVDLRKYARQIDQELRAAEIDSVSQYVEKSTDIVALHDEVQETDNILAKMQEILLGFQADLSGISDEIRSLQEESIGMNIRLKNRKEAEDKLKTYLDKMALIPSLITAIDEADVNENYLQYLSQLDIKLKFAALKQPDPNGTSFELIPSQTIAYKEVEQSLQKLKTRAIARIREFLLNKVNELKKPKTNVQMVQQNALLPMKYVVTFLSENAPEVEEEFREVYAEAMSKTLIHVFKAYHTGLVRFHEEVASKNDLIAIEEQSLKGIFSSRVNLSKKNDTFSIGDREKLLENVASPPLILHVVESEKQKLPYEAIFRSLQQHLMNSATCEYLFILDFFRKSSTLNSNTSSQQQDILKVRDLFLRVFARTLSLCLENLENYLFNCYDAIGLLMMIRITHAQRLVMEKRRIPILDSFFDRITLLLWPRFKSIFDLNVASVKNVKIKKLGAIDLHPHYVIRRYAEFASSILSLSLYTQTHINLNSRKEEEKNTILVCSTEFQMMHENGAGEMLIKNLGVLREEIIFLLTRLSEQHKILKEKSIFLVNNYDLILSVFHDRRIVSEETIKFEKLLGEQREKFVEEELMTHFGKMITFVRQYEPLILAKATGHGGNHHHHHHQNPMTGININTSTNSMTTTTTTSNNNNNNNNNSSSTEVDIAMVERVVKEFAATWKSGIEKMNGNIMKYFSNFRNGTEILKQVLTQLLLYYTRFVEIIKKSWTHPPAFGNEIVTTQEILYEIKKYSRSF